MITYKMISLSFYTTTYFHTVVSEIPNSSAVFLVHSVQDQYISLGHVLYVCLYTFITTNFSYALMCLRDRFFTGDRLYFPVEGPAWRSIFVQIPYKMSLHQ